MDRSYTHRHLERIAFQLGQRLRLGDRTYRVRGYFPNRMRAHLDHEPHVRALVARLLGARTGAFIDVGANVGQTFVGVIAADPSRFYVGCEPLVSCAFFLDQFIRDNALAHCRIVPVALSDANGMATLWSNGAFDLMASLTGDVQVDGGRRRFRSDVPTMTGDALMSALGVGAIAAIKIDVEGHELAVLRGFAGTIAAHRPAILFELLPNFFGVARVRQPDEACRRNLTLARGIEEFLAHAGYRILQLDADGREHAISGFDLDDAAAYRGADYVAYPAEPLTTPP